MSLLAPDCGGYYRLNRMQSIFSLIEDARVSATEYIVRALHRRQAILFMDLFPDRRIEVMECR